MSNDPKAIQDEFHEAVNLTAKQLESWLETEESQSVGQKKNDDEAIGHKSGKHIVEILNKQKSDYTDDDLAHMKKLSAISIVTPLSGLQGMLKTLAGVIL